MGTIWDILSLTEIWLRTISRGWHMSWELRGGYSPKSLVLVYENKLDIHMKVARSSIKMRWEKNELWTALNALSTVILSIAEWEDLNKLSEHIYADRRFDRSPWYWATISVRPTQITRLAFDFHSSFWKYHRLRTIWIGLRRLHPGSTDHHLRCPRHWTSPFFL